jgi:cell division protein ZapA
VSTESHKVTIHIMGKEYQIGCPPNEQERLLQAAQNLDKQMRNIRENGKVLGLERIAIMAALNLSHELLQEQAKHSGTNSSSQQIDRVNQKLDQALTRFKQLEL